MHFLLACLIFTLDSVTVNSTAAPTPTPTATVAVASATPVPPLTEADKKNLLKEFQRALVQDEKAFSHQESSELKQLKSAQASKQKFWRQTEKKSRRAFFDQHMSGPERRQYVQDYLQRKDKFENDLKHELDETKKTWDQRREDMKKSHMQKQADFQKALDQNQRPDPSLWPHTL